MPQEMQKVDLYPFCAISVCWHIPHPFPEDSTGPCLHPHPAGSLEGQILRSLVLLSQHCSPVQGQSSESGTPPPPHTHTANSLVDQYLGVRQQRIWPSDRALMCGSSSIQCLPQCHHGSVNFVGLGLPQRWASF